MQDAPSQTRCQSDALDPARAQALCVTLGQKQNVLAGDPLPPFFHHVYFWDAQTATHLGQDGHPKTGDLIPDLGLPRRMWAGGRLSFHRPLKTGIPAKKRSYCAAATRKEGRSGALGLVTLCHEIHQGDALCVTEWQDLIYRAAADLTAAAPQPPQARCDEDSRVEVGFTTTQLFRYSALTFNGHRIHYDRPYARDVEGYAGLVVHGPLLAQQLMLMAEKNVGPLDAFSFRATAPLLDFETAELCGSGNTFWVRGPDGRQCMIAEAEPQSERRGNFKA
ncbi:MAG: acyl dehydratase [Roseobacter sp.]